MPAKPHVERLVASREDPSYKIPLVVLNEEGLTLQDDELIAAIARYRPKTRIKPGDLVIMEQVPHYLRRCGLPYLPYIWKVRYALTRWAYDLMCLTLRTKGKIRLSEAIRLLEGWNNCEERNYRRAVLYIHGYPHGDYRGNCVFVHEEAVEPLIWNEDNMHWFSILDQSGARFRGFDPARIPTKFVLDLAPDDYSKTGGIRRPFKEEERLVHELHLAGLGEHLETPHDLQRINKMSRLDRDHDVFRKNG